MSANPGRDHRRFVIRGALALVGWLALFPLTSVDVYYHLTVGRIILSEGAIPARGVGSATFGAEPWHDNEWGFQAVVAALGSSRLDDAGIWRLTTTGSAALILLRVLTLVATLALLSAQMARMGVDPLSRALGVWLAAFLTFGNLFWAIRPQIFSYLGLAAIGYLLERDRSGCRWSRWAIPGVVLVWANLHGSFVIGVALIGAEAAGEWLRAMAPRGRRADRARAVRLSWVMLLSPVAALLNPHGYHQLLHPFLYILRPEIHRGNAEWTRPDFLHLPLLLVTVAALALGWAAGGRLRAPEVLRGALFAVLLTSAIRHLPLAVLVIVPLTLAALSRAARRGGWRRRLLPTGPGVPTDRLRLLAGVLLAGAVVALSGARFVGPIPELGERPSRPMPEQAVRWLAARGVEGNGFNAYRFGGFLMYRLYPREVAFMDGRNDLYRGFRDRVYNPILSTAHGWRNLWRQSIERYDINWAVLDDSSPLALQLADDPGWVRAPTTDGTPGEDGVGLWLRNTEPNRRALGGGSPSRPVATQRSTAGSR